MLLQQHRLRCKILQVQTAFSLIPLLAKAPEARLIRKVLNAFQTCCSLCTPDRVANVLPTLSIRREPFHSVFSVIPAFVVPKLGHSLVETGSRLHWATIKCLAGSMKVLGSTRGFTLRKASDKRQRILLFIDLQSLAIRQPCHNFGALLAIHYLHVVQFTESVLLATVGMEVLASTAERWGKYSSHLLQLANYRVILSNVLMPTGGPQIYQLTAEIKILIRLFEQSLFRLALEGISTKRQLFSKIKQLQHS